MCERQENQLESDAVEVDFASLSTASSLDCLLGPSVQLLRKLNAVAEAYVGPVNGTQGQGNEQELVSSFGNTAVQLASAVRRACELLGDLAVLQDGKAAAAPLAQDDEVPGCTEASHLMALLGLQLLLLESWLSCHAPLQADRMKLKVAQDVASSGLLSPLARLCDMVSATVIQQLAQQQQLHSEVKTIVRGLMDLTAGLLVQWPGKWFSGRILAPVLPSLLHLLVLALCNSSSWLDGVLAPYYVYAVFPQLILRVHTELEPVANSVTERQLDSLGNLSPQTVDILQSRAVQHLPLLAAASLAEQLHEHKKGAGETGTSSSTQRQQRRQVAVAQELYHAVGLCDHFLSHNMSADCPLVLELLVGLISTSATVLTCQEAVQEHSRINSRNRALPQQQHEMLVQPKVCYALLSVAVDVLALNPDNCSIAVSILTCLDCLLALLESQLSAITAEPASPRPLGCCGPEAEVLGYMQRSVEVVLLQLVPVVTQLLSVTAGAAGVAGGNEGHSSGSSSSDEIVCRLALAQLLQRVFTDRWTSSTSSDATAVLAAYQQRPSTTLASLEAGLRLLATEATMDALATEKAGIHDIHNIFLSNLATIAVHLRAMTSQSRAIHAEREQQQQQRKLISLGMSMLKCCKMLKSCDRDLQLIGILAMVLKASWLIADAAAGSNLAGISSPASITTVEASIQTTALVFTGRCLLVAADFIHAATVISSNSDQLQDFISPDLWSNIGTMLVQMTAAVQLLQQRLAASVSSACTSTTAEVVSTAVQTLQRKASALHDSLAAAHGSWQELLQQPLPEVEWVPDSPGSSGGCTLIPDGHAKPDLALTLLKLGFGASGEVAQQLTDFAAGVCAAVPVPWCCNNPACDNLSCSSDSELVSGKLCVCARCEVARYCGTECQLAHWPQHKAACKRIKASKKARLIGDVCTPTL